MRLLDRSDGIVIQSLRWLARFTSLLSIAVILLFVFSDGLRGATGRQWIGLLFFPFGVMLGMALAWKFEVRGSLLSLASLIAFYFLYGLALTGQLPRGWGFIVFTIPALLFLIAGLLHQRVHRANLFS